MIRVRYHVFCVTMLTMLMYALLLVSIADTGEAMAQQPSKQTHGGFAQPEEQPVRAELIAEHASVQPNGKTKVGVHFEMEPGWHIYAEDPGEAGLPTKVTWNGPASAQFGSLEWPTHQQLLDPGDIKTFGYSGVLVLASSLTFAPLPNQTHHHPDLVIQAHVEWLACRELCVPGRADLSLNLPVSSTAPQFSSDAELFR